MATVVIARGKVKPLLYRHPWVFDGSIERVDGAPADGDAVDVRASDGRFLGRAFWNGKSKLRARLFAWREGVEPDAAWVRERVAVAARYRREVLRLPSEETTAFRAIHGDADGLPGVAVDRLGGALSVQISSAAMDLRRDSLLSALEEEWRPAAIVEADDEVTRAKEGLPPSSGLRRGALPEGGRTVVLEGGGRFHVDLAVGQKTGFYCDQRDNRAAVAAHARGRSVLDAFSYSGGFAIRCALAGAASVEALESSAPAVRLLRENAALNQVQVTVHQGDAFKALGAARREGRRWDLVILDPPKYARSKGDLEAAAKKYEELYALGAQVTAPGGLLVCCTCSGAVSLAAFDEILRDAARTAGRELRLVERRGQAPDHPVSVTAPEGRYLQAAILHVS